MICVALVVAEAALLSWILIPLTTPACLHIISLGVFLSVRMIFGDVFSSQQSIILSMGYTPAASRSGYHERGGEDKLPQSLNHSQATTDAGASTSSKAIKKSSSSNGLSRGVEVRSRPVEYSSAMVETLFACTGPGAMDFVDDASTAVCGTSAGDFKTDRGNSTTGFSFSSIAEVASYVAWGGILPPNVMSSEAASNVIIKRQSNSNNGSSSRRSIIDNSTKGFSPCPTLPPAMLLSEWNALAYLARSMVYQTAGSYCETTYIRTGGPFEHITEYGEQQGSRGRAPFTPTECLGMIWELAHSPSQVTTNENKGFTVVAVDKVFDAHLLQLLGVAISPVMGAVEKGQRLSEMLMDIVIDVVREFIVAFDFLNDLHRMFLSLFITTSSHVSH
jgi:hypothetical protein